MVEKVIVFNHSQGTNTPTGKKMDSASRDEKRTVGKHAGLASSYPGNEKI